MSFTTIFELWLWIKLYIYRRSLIELDPLPITNLNKFTTETYKVWAYISYINNVIENTQSELPPAMAASKEANHDFLFRQKLTNNIVKNITYVQYLNLS